MSSIDHVHEQETAEGPAEQIAVDGSAGSDTDTGGPLKSDTASKDDSDVPHHARSNSVKKPTTFKAVSVTKNFLAKSGTPTAPAAKTNGDNATNPAVAGNTMPPVPRPRLVAKTASGSKASTPKSSHFGSRQGGSGPDPMQVWNRNRATPQPTPKHFTDEELKQQYGIHLATRLQADADGKESKWADIDDDEDDWAPETIEWNDGTKIDLSQNSPAALLAEEQARAMIEKERQEEERKSKMAAQQKPTTTVGPNATVLKPRSAAQPKSGGLALKTSSEKPTLVAKPSAAAPVRSPWASLPPVDKVPPVDINPPSQTSLSRPQQVELHGTNTMAPPPRPPAMEIAADDFTRTRRDTPNGDLGQLYNAQSGQYEPANAGRRGSVRKDQNFRPPSLLQRGSNYDQHGPAEPSAAFQTHRSGSQQDHPPWTRRGSSTVSGDSGPHGRRTSMNKGSDFSRIPNDMLQQRRESQPLVSPSSPDFKHEHQPQSALQSPAMQHPQPVQEARSATESPYQSRNHASDTVQANQPDRVAAQNALMKEKRELAIKRRQEREEREQAEKTERIRLKMEELGLPPLEEKNEKKESEKKKIEKRGTDTVEVQRKETEKPEVASDVAPIPAQSQDLPASISRSPPKPPVPDASGTPQQYGMMRVHGAPPNNVQQFMNDRLSIDKTRTQLPAQKVSPPILEPRPEPVEPLPSPIVNGVTTIQKHPDAPIYRAPDTQNQIMARESRQQPWNSAPRDQHAYGGWNGQSVAREPSVSNSVWGPTSHSRALGNGTFDKSVQRQQEQFGTPALAPIGPPKNALRKRQGSEFRANDLSPAPPSEDFQTIPTFPPSEAPTTPAIRSDLRGRPTSGEKQVTSPQFGAGVQPRPQINNADRPSRGPLQHQETLAAWGSFQATDAEKTRQLAQQHAARLSDDVRNGIQRPAPQLPVMNETWRQVKVDERSSQRQIIGVSRAQNTHDRPVGPQINGDIRSPSFMGPTGIPSAAAASIGRGSRFFPGAGTGLQPQYPGAVRFPPGYRRSSSPPPPEDEFHFHPAYARDPMRPLVNLPFLKVNTLSSVDDRKPKVRLPPATLAPAPSPPMPEVRAMPLRVASQPLVNNPSWQDRFNGLLGVKKTSPEKKFAHPADAFSATKVPLDLPSVQFSASVSLPPQSEEPISRVLEPASKLVEDEEELFENREFGSLPAVSIPTKAPEVGWMDAKTTKRGQARQPRLSKETEAASKDILLEKEMVVNGSVLVFVKMLGMELSKSVPMPRSSVQDAAHGASRPRNFSGNPKPNKSYKSREGLGNYGHNSKNSQGGLQRNAPQSGAAPSPRGHPSKNHPAAWGPRTANTVH